MQPTPYCSMTKYLSWIRYKVHLSDPAVLAAEVLHSPECSPSSFVCCFCLLRPDQFSILALPRASTMCPKKKTFLCLKYQFIPLFGISVYIFHWKINLYLSLEYQFLPLFGIIVYSFHWNISLYLYLEYQFILFFVWNISLYLSFEYQFTPFFVFEYQFIPWFGISVYTFIWNISLYLDLE